jgi:DNA-binding response OmpR family regulator
MANPAVPRRPRVLLVDDEADLVEALAAYLGLSGFDVRTAADGRAMREAVTVWRPDAVVLDLRLGRDDGLSLADWLMAAHPAGEAPGLLFLSGAAGMVEKVVGLEIGADDFLLKPIAPRELLARLRTLLARLGRPLGRGRLVRLGAVAVDVERQVVVGADGAESPLGPGEFALLKCFLDEPDRVFTRDDLLDLAPATDDAVADRAIDRRIARLRRKLEAGDDAAPVIEAVRGYGYRLAAGTLAPGG